MRACRIATASTSRTGRRSIAACSTRRRYEHTASSKPDAGTPQPPDETAPSGEAEKQVSATTPPKEEHDEEPPLAAEEEAPPPRRHSRDKHGSKSREKDHAKERAERDRDRAKSKDPFHNPDTTSGRPLLKELRGRGVLVRKLAHGFTVALDGRRQPWM